MQVTSKLLKTTIWIQKPAKNIFLKNPNFVSKFKQIINKAKYRSLLKLVLSNTISFKKPRRANETIPTNNLPPTTIHFST